MPLLPPFRLHSFDLGLGLGGRAVQPVPQAVLPLVPGCAVPRVSVRCLGGSTAHSHVTHVRYYQLLPCGTTAAFQAPEVPPPSTGLYQTSGTTAPLSGSTRACVWAYIYSTGLKGCLFSLRPRSSFSCPSRRPSLPLPQSASRASDPWLSMDSLRGGLPISSHG